MKNKYLTLLVMVIYVSFMACNVDEEEEMGIVADALHIELSSAILDNIPSNLKTDTKLVYTSSSGEEWILTVGNNIDSKTLTRPENTPYTHEQITINAVDLTNNNLIYAIVGRGQLDQSENVVNNITSVLRHDVSSFVSVGFDVDSDGLLQADVASQFCEDIDFSNDKYTSAFKMREDIFNAQVDQQIYYTPEYGVIAFTGPNSKMWVLDRVEE